MSDASHDGQNSEYFENAYYALVDFCGQKMWIYIDEHVPSLLIPNDSTLENSSFSHKMLNFKNTLYQVNGGEFEKYLSISPPSIELSEVFLSFIRSVLDDIGKEKSITSAIEKVIATYEDWSEFFGIRNFSSDKTSKVIGIIGELCVLEGLVETKGPKVLTNWWGPARHRHDFEFDEIAVEVKSTINLYSNEVEIHGLSQLLPDENRLLFLAHIKINLDPNGINLSELIQRLLTKNVSKFELTEKIRKSGVTDDLIDAHGEFRFTDFIARYYKVDSAFPSITPSNLSSETLSRISKVNYGLKLDGITSSAKFPEVN